MWPQGWGTRAESPGSLPSREEGPHEQTLQTVGSRQFRETLPQPGALAHITYRKASEQGQAHRADRRSAGTQDPKARDRGKPLE